MGTNMTKILLYFFFFLVSQTVSFRMYIIFQNIGVDNNETQSMQFPP